MINLDSTSRIHGHLEIVKVFNDGREEVVFNDHNTIVSGMGVGLSFLFTLSGSLKITDYQNGPLLTQLRILILLQLITFKLVQPLRD